MTSVEINAGGRYVKVQQDGRDAELLMPLAEKAWDHTEAAEEETPGGALGFRDERRYTPTASATSTWVEPPTAQGR